MIPVTTPTPTRTDNPLFGILPECDNTNGSNSKPSPLEHSDLSNESPAPITYRARSNSLARSPRLRSQERPHSVCSSHQSVVSESNSESCSESSTPVCSPTMSSSRKSREKNPHVRSASSLEPSQIRTRSSHSDSGVMAEQLEGELTDIGSSREPESQARISRRVTSPISVTKQPRPRMLNFDAAVSAKRPSTAPANCRDSRHLSTRPALPTPSRVSPRPQSVTSSPVPLGGPLSEEGDSEADVESRQGVSNGGSTLDGGSNRSTKNGKGKDESKLSPAKASRKQVSNRGRKMEETAHLSSASPRKATPRKTAPNGGTATHHTSTARASASPNERLKQAKKPAEKTSGTSKSTGANPSKRNTLAAGSNSDSDHHRETTSNPSLGSPPANDDVITDRASSTLPRKVKSRHTVIYKEKSPLSKKSRCIKCLG